MEPYKYQIEVLRALKETRKNGAHSALVVLATGLGKTVVSAFDVEQYMLHNRGRALFLCHNNGILEQNMGAFQNILDGEFTYGLFNGINKAPEAEFLFASFQTMLDHKEEFTPDTFKYIVVDEAHHAPAETFRKVIDYFRPDFLLGMTATPHRLDGLKLEDVFGPITYNLGLTEAIRRGLLVDIHYHLILDELADLDSVKIDDKKISMKKLNRQLFIPKRDEEIARIITKRMSELQAKSSLIFCRSIEHAETMCTLIEGAKVVHSELSNKDNQEALESFRQGETPVIISVDQLNEGIDIPHADLIVFLRSTVSPTVFYQQLGRGLRLHEGKEYATVLDFVGNYYRLEILNNMAREINRLGDVQDERFVLNIEAPQFHDVKVDIATILDRIDRLVFGWSDDELIEQVQMLAARLGRTPTRKEFDKDSNVAGTWTVSTHFGSWNKFLEAAGLEANLRMGITDEELVSQVQMLAKELGRAPTIGEFNKDSRTANTTTAIRRFGSWNEFLRAAGLEANLRMDITDEELVSQVQMLAKELGRVPTIGEFDKDSRTASRATVKNHFGSWNEFLRAAGLEVNLRMIITDEELVRQVQMLAKELGKAPTIGEFNKDPRTASATTAKDHFDSWNKFLEAAGLETNLQVIRRTYRHTDVTSEGLISQLQMLAKEFGKAPTRNEFDKDPRTAGATTAIKRFGSWNKFLEAAGLEINMRMRMNITDEELVSQVQMLAKELGRAPTRSEFDKDPRTASESTLKNHFGPWKKLLEAAGFEINYKYKTKPGAKK